jgi:putative endonuclease
MNAHCYILYSKTLKRFYTGACQGDLQDRINRHNNHSYGKHRFTSTASDWELFIAIELKDYARAVRLERHIKSMKSSKFIRNLKKYPEMVEKVIKEAST